MSAYSNDTKGFEEFVNALTDECSVKYGSEFGKLLVALSARKYGKHIVEMTAEQLHHEFSLIVAQELGCLGSTTDNLRCIQQNIPTLQKLDALCKSLSMDEANIVVNFIEAFRAGAPKVRWIIQFDSFNPASVWSKKTFDASSTDVALTVAEWQAEYPGWPVLSLERVDPVTNEHVEIKIRERISAFDPPV